MKTRRKQMGLSLDKLAQLTDSSKSYIWELEKGCCEPSITKAFLIAKGLGVSLEWLCGDDLKAHDYLARIGAKVVKIIEGSKLQ